MAFPVIGKNVGSGVDQLKAQIVGWIRDEIRASQRGGNGLHVDGATGDLVADIGRFRSNNYVAGSAGWGLQPNGNAEFNDLTLRGGIIGNDSLTSPVVPQSVQGGVGNFALSTTGTTIKTITITVPAGFTSAAVSVTARVFGYNPNTTGGSNGQGADYLYGVCKVNGLSGNALPLSVGGNGGSGLAVSVYSTVLTGLTPGSTFTITIAAQSFYAAWTANGANSADISGMIFWLR